jgi:hypothetical protein
MSISILPNVLTAVVTALRQNVSLEISPRISKQFLPYASMIFFVSLASRFSLQVNDSNICPFFCKENGHGFSYSAIATGNEQFFIGQSSARWIHRFGYRFGMHCFFRTGSCWACLGFVSFELAFAMLFVLSCFAC